jgi:hypothetical protein
MLHHRCIVHYAEKEIIGVTTLGLGDGHRAVS